MTDRIAIVSYESPFAPGGGIAAVMKHLPAHLSRVSKSEVIVITPFHRKNQKTLAVEPLTTLIATQKTKFGGKYRNYHILRLNQSGTWYFIKPADPTFFAGTRHPYDVKNSATLLRDALFFGMAAARAPADIDPRSSWTLLLQDWEAATTALAIPGLDSSPSLTAYLTLHNSYDSPASDTDLLDSGISPEIAPGDTILERALQLVEEPVFTVSDQFAKDLTEEDLQIAVMAPHLQTALTGRLIGIDNGPFTGLAVGEQALKRARQGDDSLLIAWKNEMRKSAQAALDALEPAAQKPVWGDLHKFQFDGSPWFVLAGRDDPRQKGYDVACIAIEDYLQASGEGSFIFFPIPGDEGLAGLAFLEKLACEYPEKVLCLPFIFQEGYFEVLRGADYGIMPSLYEPFGMANEFYLNGCVGIGRATGGIVQQIIPDRAAASFNDAVKNRSDRLFGAAAFPTGFLYRERDGMSSAIADWQAINTAGYKVGGSPNRVEQRKKIPLIQAMARELTICISDATILYRNVPDLYYQLLINGISFIQNSLSWERTAQAYLMQIE